VELPIFAFFLSFDSEQGKPSLPGLEPVVIAPCIIFDLNPTPTKIDDDGYFEPAVMGRWSSV